MTSNDPAHASSSGPRPQVVPAFPLGTVLLPGQLLNLVVFEPRYKVMLFDLRTEDPAEFLVTLILRGSEVGGGDVRSDVGCLAQVLRAEDLPDGRVLLDVIGTEPRTVLEWMEEDPYPRALITGDAIANHTESRASTDRASLALAIDLDREITRLLDQLGIEKPASGPLPEPPEAAIWALALRNPIGTLDRQSLLEEPDIDARAHMLVQVLEGQVEILAAQAALENPPPTD